jgi:hypothetical protein
VVEAIDGIRHTYSDTSGDKSLQTRWGFYVNGIKIHAKPTEHPLVAGDVVQFDLGDIDGVCDEGGGNTFPRTFTGGVVGFKPHTTLRCAPSDRSACDSGP